MNYTLAETLLGLACAMGIGVWLSWVGSKVGTDDAPRGDVIRLHDRIDNLSARLQRVEGRRTTIGLGDEYDDIELN